MPTSCCCTACLNGSRKSVVELGLRHGRDALIDRVAAGRRRAVRRAAVADEVLGGGQHAGRSGQRAVALEAVDDRLHLRRRAPGPRRSDSYVRPQRSSRVTQRHGENAHGTPVARVSVGGDCAVLLHRAPDHASRRGRCCAGTASRRRGCCGRARRRRRRSAGSADASPAPRSGTRRSCRPTPPACSASASSRRRRAASPRG